MTDFAFLDSPVQWAMLAIAVLVLFGPDKLPDLMRQVGRGIRDFRKYSSDLSSSLRLDEFLNDTPAATPPTPYPTAFDSYGNPIPAHSTGQTPDPAVISAPVTSTPSSTYSASNTPPVGDFASSALSDGAPARPDSPRKAAPLIRPAQGAESRIE